MNRHQELVREFHRKVTKQPCSPAEPKLRTPALRALLQLEEAIEKAFALVGPQRAQTFTQEMLSKVLLNHTRKNESPEPSVIGAIGETVDNLVISYGSAEDIGVDIGPFFEAVMEANMRKAGGPIDANGKAGKPPGWQPADLNAVMQKVLAERDQPPIQVPTARCVRCGKDMYDPAHVTPCRSTR